MRRQEEADDPRRERVQSRMRTMFWTLFISLTLLALLALVGCGSSPERGRAALEDLGFTNIQMLGFTLSGQCGRLDSYTDKFRAVTSQGLPVTGIVCCNLADTCSVRLIDRGW